MNQREIDELKIFIVEIHTKLSEINQAWVASLDSFIKAKEAEIAPEPVSIPKKEKKSKKG